MHIHKKYNLTLLFVFVLVNPLVSQHKTAIENGKLIDTVFCMADPGQSYALYLPSNYSPEKAWPAIYVFEPAARGKLPVSLFKAGAEKYGYVIVASNNSRNGNWDNIIKAGNAMFEDTFARFSIDQSRVYTSGFSGGSRAATAIASITGRISGIIACGAGFSSNPSYQPKKGMKLSYVGIVGDKDMNYQEHHAVKRQLDQMGIDNQLILFDGKHSWPDAATLQQAIEWLQVGAMKMALLPQDQNFLQQKFDEGLFAASHLNGEDNLIEKHRRLTQLNSAFEGLADMKGIEDSIRLIQSDRAFKKAVKRREGMDKKEFELRDYYVQALTELNIAKFQNNENLKDEEWWGKEAKFLNNMMNSHDPEKSKMAKRVFNMIWANCAETSAGYIVQNDLKSALVFSELWVRLQPESVWALWNLAKVYALQEKVDLSLQLLGKAYENGMRKSASLTREPAFAILKKDKRYQELLQQLN